MNFKIKTLDQIPEAEVLEDHPLSIREETSLAPILEEEEEEPDSPIRIPRGQRAPPERVEKPRFKPVGPEVYDRTVPTYGNPREIASMGYRRVDLDYHGDLNGDYA